MNSGCFKKGITPWNKGTKGVMKKNSGTFVNGQRAGERNNTWKGGLQKHKDGYYIYLGVGKRMRRGRYNFEQVYGELPKEYVIYHRDGDCFNDDIENLEAITRGELAMRNRIN